MILTKEAGKKILAENLRRIMAEQHVTQEVLAEAAKVSQSLISKILNEKVSPDSIDVRNIAEVLQVSQDDLHAPPQKKSFRKTG